MRTQNPMSLVLAQLVNTLQENATFTVPTGKQYICAYGVRDTSLLYKVFTSGTYTVSNATMGRDPVPGIAKTAWIFELWS